MKVLVTGGTGFIGSYLAKELVKKNYNVRCLVRITSDISRLPKEVELWYGDLTNPKSLNNIAKDIDIAVHLAGIGDINAISYKNYLQYKKVNVDGTRNLLEECRKSINIKKFIHISSIAAMGVIRKNGKINENDLCKPKTPYEKSKYESELVVKRFKVPYIILRPSMVYDWENPNNELKKLVRFIKFGIIPVIGDGNKKMAMVHISKVINVIIHMINNNAKNETYIVNNKESFTLNEIISVLSKSLYKRPIVIHIPVRLIKIPIKIVEYFAKTFAFIPPFTSERIKSITINRVYATLKLKKVINE